MIINAAKMTLIRVNSHAYISPKIIPIPSVKKFCNIVPM